MKYYLFKIHPGENNFFTYSVIEKLARINGHEICSTPEAADYLLVSLCDVTQVHHLEKIWNEYKNTKKRIICGGHFAVNYKVCACFSDLVNLGQGFEFFECKTYEEAAALPCTYYDGKGIILRPSTLIRWEQFPVVQTSAKMYYYIGGVGCKNKCQFCLTSWVNKHQKNSEMRIKKAEQMLPPGARLNVIANEYEGGLKVSPVKDMMLKDFINVTKKTSKLIRIGYEFVRPENRQRFGKAFPDEYFFRAVELSKKLKIEVQFFCIGGIDTRADWQTLFEKIPTDRDRAPRLYFKFTNLVYEQFTPMYKYRHDLDCAKYLDGDFGHKLFNMCAVYNKRTRIFPIAYPGLAFWRMGVQLSTNREQYDQFAALRSSRDSELIFKTLKSSGVLQTDYQKTVQFWYQEKPGQEPPPPAGEVS